MKPTYQNFRLMTRIFLFQNYQLTQELILETVDGLAFGIDTIFSFIKISPRNI